MKLSKGDAVTYVALVTSAVLQALEPWRKEASMPPEAHPILSNSVWAYIPISLLIIVGLIWLGRQLAIRTGSREMAGASQTSPLSSSNETKLVKTISTAQLVPSGKEMALIITPSRGNVTVGLFADVSHHRAGGDLDYSGWPKPERFYLGDVRLLAANHRLSVAVMDQSHEESTPLPLRGWLWKLVKADGTPSETRPCSISGKEKVVFVFITQDGEEQRFPMLLIYATGNPSAHPTVITQNDIPL